MFKIKVKPETETRSKNRVFEIKVKPETETRKKTEHEIKFKPWFLWMGSWDSSRSSNPNRGFETHGGSSCSLRLKHSWLKIKSKCDRKERKIQTLRTQNEIERMVNEMRWWEEEDEEWSICRGRRRRQRFLNGRLFLTETKEKLSSSSKMTTLSLTI